VTARLDAAVVGAGFVGHIHARALAGHPDVRLVGICGRTSPKTEALAALHGVPAFLSVEELLERTRPHLVCIATGNDEHCAPTLAALAAGADVFCEKPLAFRPDEARAMAAAAGASRRLGVNFNHRYSEPYQRALRYVAEGELGPAAYVAIRFAGSLYKELNDPYCQLIETQGHSFDLLRLFGGEIVELSAQLADPRAIGVYTSAAVAVRFASSAVGSLLGSWDSSYEHPGSQRFEYCAVGGRVEVDDVVDAVRLYRNEDDTYREWRPGIFDARRRDFWRTIDAHVHAFVDAILDDRPAPVGATAGVKALELCVACARSFESRRAVQLPSS
jgi:predicted dehydrogenase